MEQQKQLQTLRDIGPNPSFADKIEQIGRSPLTSTGVDILQINVGKVCNLRCRHCHVEAGPDRREVMSREVLQACLEIFGASAIPTVDITGGAPEMNPHLSWFIEEVGPFERRLIVRTNLLILLDEKYEHLIDVYVNNRVEVVASLPHYRQDRTDKQRGEGAFRGIVEMIKVLNRKGYGQEDSGLILDIVHNPVGAYLPGSQEALEHEYRRRLGQEYGVVFNNLFCITNVPVGRYLEYLLKTGNFEDYMSEMVNAFNPAAVDRVMCKTTVSVGWDGALYDCDFNQMLALPVNHGAPDHIDDFDLDRLRNRQIVIANHCYGCTAGCGSSCQGQTADG